MLIRNARIATFGDENKILENHALYIAGDRIAAVGSDAELVNQYPEADQIDARGQLVMPGNICAHTHFYSAFARGLGIPGRAPKDFPEILEKLWWPLDKALDTDAVKYSALIMLIDAIRNGTTTLIDHHASPNAIDGSLDLIAEAVDESGLRAVLCYEVTDRDGKAKAAAGIAENLRFLKKAESGEIAGGRVAATFGLHASLTLTDETLVACRQAVPEGVGFHIHVAEHEADEFDSIEKSGKRVVDRLRSYEILGPRTIVAHAVHTDAREMAVLAETGTWVSHQPRSNMNNGVGVAPIESLDRLGVRVCLGTDGFPHNMWEEIRFAYMLQKVHYRDPRRMAGDKLFEIAFSNNASLAESFFSGKRLGVISEGAQADLIFVDYRPHTLLEPGNLPWHIIFGLQERMVTTTIVGGRILMKDRKILVLDEGAVIAKARDLAPSVWKRYELYANA